jgi:IS30 family transposase
MKGHLLLLLVMSLVTGKPISFVLAKTKKVNIFTMRERKSHFLIALKNHNHSPTTLINNLNQDRFMALLKVKTITFDNDIAFRKHEEIARMFSTNTYFCDLMCYDFCRH